ncbi:phosphate ABC transporter substrate-binding protein PstS [Thermogemmatispora sp.]|uniref:phosphate ABC transporter substrate-binding protein PstS n=1 Tax=Thermogemmatispora sp. TaxID=1968838 RepID=UPI00338FD0DD
MCKSTISRLQWRWQTHFCNRPSTSGLRRPCDEEWQKPGPILHIPVTIGAEAISYNLTSVPGTQHVRFTGPLLADIYLGKVTSWDDPRLKQLNPDVSLPHQAITVIHRSDGSGTTAIFTKYLATVSEAWASQVGAGSTVNWPVGVGAKGNEGVAAAVRTTAGAIGYIELQRPEEQYAVWPGTKPRWGLHAALPGSGQS